MADIKKTKDLIAKAKDDNATFLDIGNLGLTELPNELFELKQLEFLNIGSHYIKDNKLVNSNNHGGLNIIKWVPWKIRRLSNLKSLSLHATYVGDISGLKELSGLKYLDLSFAYFVKDYSPLKYMRNIEILNLHTNYLKELPFLKRFKKLKYLDLSFNDFRNLDFLKNLENVNTLGIQWFHGVLDINDIIHLSDLRKLNIASNTIKDLDKIKHLVSLEDLNLYHTNLSTVENITSLQKLKILNLWKNQIFEVEPLTMIKSLIKLNLRENKVKNIKSLQKLRHLRELDVSFNQIESDDIEILFKNLDYLSCQGNLFNFKI